ncbi:helix-turn-helix transcriptional regulator [Streptomyces sedi]
MAGLSVEYYTRLEQGRAVHPSREILTALARAFRLSSPERDHLFRLAGERTPPSRAPTTKIRSGLRQLLDGLNNVMPVTVHDGRLDILAFNTAAADLFGPLFGDGRFGRNIAHQAFTATGLDKVLGTKGAEQLARVATAELRKALSHYPEDPYLRSLFRELTTKCPEFDRHWQKGEIGTWSSVMKHVNHPTKGPLIYDSEMLHDPENDHWVLLFTPHQP